MCCKYRTGGGGWGWRGALRERARVKAAEERGKPTKGE